MTKPGYTHIIVPKSLHHQLKALAQQNNLSISQLISQLINVNVNVNVNVGINTSINTTLLTEQKQSSLQTLNQQNSQNQATSAKRERNETVGSHQMVGLPGFEPGSRAPEAQSLDQASRQPPLGLHYLILHR